MEEMIVYIVVKRGPFQIVHSSSSICWDIHSRLQCFTPASVVFKYFRWDLVPHIQAITVDEVGAFIALADD